jgi:hypothetical protein
MPESSDDLGDNSPMTVAGCLLMAVSVAVIGALAVFLVTWRSPGSGRPLPRQVAMIAPILGGALCFGIGTALLRLFGVRVVKKPQRGPDEPPEEADAAPENKGCQG